MTCSPTAITAGASVKEDAQVAPSDGVTHVHTLRHMLRSFTGTAILEGLEKRVVEAHIAEARGDEEPTRHTVSFSRHWGECLSCGRLTWNPEGRYRCLECDGVQ